MSSDCGDVVSYIVSTGIGCFLVGVVVSVLFLIRFPRLYRMMRMFECPRCPPCRQKETPVRGQAREPADNLPYAMTDLSFRALQERARRQEATKENIQGKRYQPFQSESRKKFHKYTPYQGKPVYRVETGIPNEGYEYMHVSSNGNDGFKPALDHYYFILEPNTKQPVNTVRRMAEEEEIQYDNPNHIYFILEPNADKLKQIDETEEMTERMPDHVYFVLEKEPQEHYIVPEIPQNGPQCSQSNFYDESS